MSVKLMSSVLVGVMLAVVGCASPPTDPTAVSVRFAPVPDFMPFDDGSPTFRTTSDASGESFDSEYIATSSASDLTEAFTVTLWGGDYEGHDVSLVDAPLRPGNYTFGFWDHERDMAMKGWVEVNFAGTQLVDTLRQWKSRIPQQKQWLAYDFEVKGKLDTADSVVFKSFARQLRAFDKLEREMDSAIAVEMQLQEQRRRQYGQMLNESVVLMLPTGSGIFHPTTEPVFAPEDVADVQTGEAVTKFMLVADAQGTQKKLRLVNRVCRSMQGCRAVLVEEVDRLERLKRYLVTTDHIYNHNRKFVENEMRIQQALNSIDQLNEEIGDMRERRLALSFTNGLVSPDRFLEPITTERRDIDEERTVLSTRQTRLDMMFDATAEDSPRRIAFQRQRLRVSRAIEDIDRYAVSLGEAQVALTSMRESTRVIHRQGDLRLLAAAFVDPSVPSRIREAIEHDAAMIVRLEASPTRAEPLHAVQASMRTASYTVDTSDPCDP